jgi:uncharacterized protein (DUF2141 family)
VKCLLSLEINPAMKKYVVYMLPLFMLVFSCKKEEVKPPVVDVPGTGTVTDTLGKIQVNLSGMQNTNGKINLALYNSSASFNDPNAMYQSLVVNPVLGNMTFTLDSIPEGTYAFGVFHDENNNLQIDQNWLGIPTEGFAFSNNAMGTFGPPSFDQSKFVVVKQQTHVQTISLHFY